VLINMHFLIRIIEYMRNLSRAYFLLGPKKCWPILNVKLKHSPIRETPQTHPNETTKDMSYYQGIATPWP
jgi:hypothetical protein